MKFDSSLFLSKKWIFLIVLLLAVVFISNMLTSNQIVGWDNFSVSLNFPLNLARSLSTWREYRGFGVASDSENVDAMRIVILSLASIILPVSIVEYVYTLALFIVGVISVFFLIRSILIHWRIVKDQQIILLGSLVGATYYAGNLHAFETFFFPMAMYTARFAYFPLFLLAFFRLLTRQKLSSLDILFLVVASLLLATSYLTATIFITVCLFLLLFTPAFHYDVKRTVSVGLLFLILNAFWLIPFANYSIQKSSLIPKASSFTVVNEALLNKPEENSSFENLFTFFPETLNKSALPFLDLKTGEKIVLHPLSDPALLSKFLLAIPVLLATVGAGYSLLLVRKKRLFAPLYVVVIVVTMLFLLRKSLLPFGWLYEFIATNIPLFAIVFRFSGTKFYPLLLIAMTILVALGSMGVSSLLLKQFPRRKNVVQFFVASFLILAILFPFESTFRGQLISELVKNDLPSAYEEIAVYLKDKNSNDKIIYLPYDQHSYWRVHTWGYIGSSFLNFLIDQPLLDRTFEPASPQLDAFNSTLMSIIISGRSIDEKSELVAGLLDRGGVKYVLFDETISQDMLSRNIKAWGVFNEDQTQEIVTYLETSGKLNKVASGYVDAKEVALFEINSAQPMFGTAQDILQVDPNIENTFIEPLLASTTPFIQREGASGRTYPFWQPDKDISFQRDTVTLEQSFEHGDMLMVSTATGTESVYQVYAKRQNENLDIVLIPWSIPIKDAVLSNEQTIISFTLPEFDYDENTTSVGYLGSWHAIPIDNIGEYRISLNDEILPVPQYEIAGQAQPLYIGSILSTASVSAKLFKLEEQNTQLATALQPTDDPNCFGDKKQDYKSSISRNGTVTVIETTSGMTCLTTPFNVVAKNEVNRLFEVTVPYKVSTQPTDAQYRASTQNYYHRALVQMMNTQPEYNPIVACLFDPKSSLCLNKLQLVKSPQDTIVTLQSNVLSSYPGLQLLLVVPGSEGAVTTAQFDTMEFRSFVQVEEKIIAAANTSNQTTTVITDPSSVLTLSFPYIQSSDTFLQQPLLNSLETLEGNCVAEKGYRSVISPLSMPILSYVNNCYQGISTSLPYNPARFYLWQADYSVQAGKQPLFIIKGDTEYKNEFLSRYQEYPFFEGFRQLQQANKPFSWNYGQKVNDILENAPFYRTHTTLMPGSGGASENLKFEINQTAEGFSVLGVRGMNIFSLPKQWADLAVDDGDPMATFAPMTIRSFKKLWPSVWQVEVEKTGAGDSLLIFGQAYDKQWQLFNTDSVLQAFLGMHRIDAEQAQVNGWSNGWIIPESEVSGVTTLIVLYIPERLLVIGTLITLIGIGVGSWALLHFKTRLKSEQTFEEIRTTLHGK